MRTFEEEEEDDDDDDDGGTVGDVEDEFDEGDGLQVPVVLVVAISKLVDAIVLVLVVVVVIDCSPLSSKEVCGMDDAEDEEGEGKESSFG